MKTRFPRSIRVISYIFATLFIAIVLGESSAFAQSQAQPVARLISSSVIGSMTRPRRVEPSSASLPNNPSVVAPLSFDEATTIERTAFDKTNEARVKNGLQPLEWDGVLCRMARMHSEDMAHRGYFDHDTPEGLRPRDRGRALGITHFRVLGENIAYNKGFQDPGGFAVERWLLSPGHRANIMYVGFQASAIGSYIAADGSVYLTQVFITR
ncbi:MAG TPA: CAP domain-containing protein [Pyrinomonadaceae bacterium]|nr:CAP domain-containing protein [Pyrinomonadaceae bacterium]